MLQVNAMSFKNTLSNVNVGPAASPHSTPIITTPPPTDVSNPRDSAVSVSPQDGTMTLTLHQLQQLVDTAVANHVATLRSQVRRESQRIGEQIDELEREVSARLEKRSRGKRARRGRFALNTKFKARAGGKSASSAEPAAKVDAEAPVRADEITTANERTPAAPCPPLEDEPTTVEPGPASLEVASGEADLAAVPVVAIAGKPPAAPPINVPAPRPACPTNARNRITHAPNCSCPLSMQEIWIELFVKDPATRWPQHKESSKRVSWAENVVSQVFTWSDGDEDEAGKLFNEIKPKRLAEASRVPEQTVPEPRSPRPGRYRATPNRPTPFTPCATFTPSAATSEPEEPNPSAASTSSNTPPTPPRTETRQSLFGLAKSFAWAITPTPARFLYQATGRTASAFWHIREGGVNDLLVDVVDAGFDAARPWLDMVSPWMGFEDDLDDLRLNRIPLFPGFEPTTGDVVRALKRVALGF
ncbi:hypothetical protein HDU96_005110 [Phlyctochytrium bullatum]|nr:hypothetical protein HDU96_005110 [Phlyctochytrium bullatum]